MDPPLAVVIGVMHEQPARVWNSAELHQLYMEASGCKDGKSTRHARRRLATKLSTHFGNELVVMQIDGCASLLCFRQYVPFHLNADVADGIDDNVLEQLTEQIRQEVKSIPIQKNYDISSFTYASAVEGTSNTLLSLIARLVSDGAVTKTSLSLAQSIQHHVAKWHNQTTLGLAVKFHHRFGSKEAVDLLHEYGFAVTYDEVMRFRKSVAVHTASHTSVRQLPSSEVPASGWFDNFDLNIFTPNGRRETHAMAIEFTQQKAESSTDSNATSESDITRLTKLEARTTKLGEISAVPIQHHRSRGRPAPPAITIHEGLSFSELHKLNATVEAATEADYKWMSNVLTKESQDLPPLDWSGHMAVSARQTTTRNTVRVWPADRFAASTPGYSPDDIGARGEILARTGYAHHSSCGRYAAVQSSIADQVVRSGKVETPRAAARRDAHVDVVHRLHRHTDEVHRTGRPVGLRIRWCAQYDERQSMAKGIRMVTTALLDDIHSRCSSAVDLQAELENARKLPTGRLWVDCLVIPIAIIHMFIRAERESDWLLHLYCVQQMLPYFFAAGHANYARYGAWYLLEMRGALPAAARQMFLNGDHVCRHRSGVWNSVFSDQFGEQTYIRYGKAKGGLVGITLNPDQVAEWVLSYHICNTVSLAMDDMFDNEEDGEMG